MRTKKKHKWKYQINIKKKILVLIILGVFLFIGLGYAVIESSLSIIGTLAVEQPFTTVTFDADGGTVSPTTKNYIKGKNYTDLPTPTKTGYQFLGWNGKNILHTYDKESFTRNGVTSEANNGVISISGTNTGNADYDIISFSENLPKLEIGKTYTLSTSKSLTGLYVQINYKDTSNVDRSLVVIHSGTSSTVTVPNTFDYVSSYFIGVAGESATTIDEEFTVQLEEASTATEYEPYYITNNTKIVQKENHTLKAMWKLEEYTVSFNVNGGSGGQSADVTATYSEAMPTISATAPTRTGYQFVGWFDAQTAGTKYYNVDGTSARDFDKTSDTTLYAQWGPGLGKYFTLVPDEATATTTTAGFSGSTPTSDQTLWRVININDNGTVDAVSEYVSSDTITISGVNGYKNYVAGLQDIATKYAKAGYTVSTRMMGYDGQTLSLSSTSAFDGSSLIAPSTTSTPSPTTGTGEEYSGGILGDTLYLKDYQLVSSVYLSDTTTYGNTGLKAYNKVGTAQYYRLASRIYTYFDGTYSSFYFCGRTVNDNGYIGSSYIRRYFSGWDDGSYSFSVRPIITLKSGITTASGTGTKADPYILN